MAQDKQVTQEVHKDSDELLEGDVPPEQLEPIAKEINNLVIQSPEIKEALKASLEIITRSLAQNIDTTHFQEQLSTSLSNILSKQDESSPSINIKIGNLEPFLKLISTSGSDLEKGITEKFSQFASVLLSEELEKFAELWDTLYPYMEKVADKSKENGEEIDPLSPELLSESMRMARKDGKLLPGQSSESDQISLIARKYFPMLNGYPTNDLMSISNAKMDVDDYSLKAVFTKNGRKITLNNPNEVLKVIGVSAKKLIDTATVFLTEANYCGKPGDILTHVNPTATISLMDYWRAQGLHVDPLPMATEEEQKKEQSRVAETIKKLKQSLKADLENLKGLEWEGKGTGRNSGDFAKFSYISSYRLKGTTLYVNFDVDMAKYLLRAGYQMQWSPLLLRHDNRDPNSYVIGRKLFFHHSMDSNAAAGTDNTQSVRSLLEEAPDIQSYEILLAKGQRNWKRLIKEKLEAALNRNITTSPILKRWEYRNPITGKTYTPETAASLTWNEYYNLMVDFVLAVEPDQESRRAARALEKAEAEAKSQERSETKSEKKKRGRPRKEKAD